MYTDTPTRAGAAPHSQPSISQLCKYPLPELLGFGAGGHGQVGCLLCCLWFWKREDTEVRSRGAVTGVLMIFVFQGCDRSQSPQVLVVSGLFP